MRHTFIERMKKTTQLSAFLIFSGAVLSACATYQAQTVGEFLTTKDYVEIGLTKLDTGHEMVEGIINGQAGQFILDSGAGLTVIHSSDASKFKLNIDENSPEHVIGAGGEGKLFKAQVDSISIGGETIQMDKIAVIDLSHVVNAIEKTAGVRIQGVVGQDILTSYNGIIDVKNSRLYLATKQGQ